MTARKGTGNAAGDGPASKGPRGGSGARRSRPAPAGPAPRMERGLLARLGTAAADTLTPGPCLLVTDRTVARLHGAVAEEALRGAGFRPRVVALPPGERNKTLSSVGRLLAALASVGAHRRTPVIAMGGGVITDLGGFAAAVYARGVPWVAVPTTVMAMADAAVGGKTAVDLPAGKNLAGAFHPPTAVLADPDLLATLPPRHVRNGLAEVAKVFLLDGMRRGLPALEGLRAAAEGDASALEEAVRDGAMRKHRIVSRDPRETRGRRILLNLGHTVGHGLEAATGYDGSLLHGEAVSVGMVAATTVAAGRGLVTAAEREALVAALRGLGLPVTRPRGVTAAAVMRHVGVDKKRAAGALRMVLPRSRAGAVVAVVDPAELRTAL